MSHSEDTAPPPPADEALAPVNILLVDDQPGRLLTYRAILEPLGENLVDASSGMQALQRLMDQEFAVILLDVNMPGMDGFETASLIHQHPRFENTPIIFVTAVNVTDMDRLRGYKLGAVDYVMVPVIPEILRSKVVVLAELFRKRRQLQQANLALEAEKARELEQLNESLRRANDELGQRNRELREEVAERANAEQRLRFLADTIPSIVWTCAPDGTITYANRNWFEYYGHAAEGDGPSDLTRLVLHPDDSQAVHDLVVASLAAGEKFEFEARHRNEEGDYCWFMTRAVPWRNEAGKLVSWFGISTSIDQLKQLMERLREADQRKDEFLATLAHELRNPLAPLLNALNVRRLAAPGGTPEPLQDLMERQLALLVRLIDDLLDIARITRGKLELRQAPTTLQAVLESAVETAMPLIEQGRHELRMQLPDTRVPLHADGLRLSQVFANLLNNAAKYSDAGGLIELVAELDDQCIEVAVRDRGIGLSAEQTRDIFELFSQADTAIERAHGGLGIGLTLVRRLTEMHGGEVSVHSDGLGRGSQFLVRLPRTAGGDALAMHVPAPQAAIAREVDTGRADAVHHRALVVDDNRDAADTLAMMLELLGLEVRCLYEPAGFEAGFAEFQPQIVFLDVGMPGRSGYDVARALRAAPGGDDVVLVAVTGWGQPEDRRRTREAGFDHHLVKPPELPAIQSICTLLDTRGTPA
ncbi:hybrid sensor histidine kinase/response regulator [Cognatiluteimonas telluris]|uniref:hybrid sensor histidine kinase/response regulator n=1 Tax=Cognatiluteimonas telluris TaxID=1104775 RepID=UPI00140CAE88|nr:response regulator [Lysobacter telluris]